MVNNLLKTCFLGAGAGANAYISLDYLLDNAASRTLILQNGLTKASEVTSLAYQNVEMANYNSFSGIISGMAAGILAASAVYYACKKGD